MQGNQVAKELLEALIHVTDVKMGCKQRLILIKGKLTQNCRRFKQRNVKLCLQFVNHWTSRAIKRHRVRIRFDRWDLETVRISHQVYLFAVLLGRPNRCICIVNWMGDIKKESQLKRMWGGKRESKVKPRRWPLKSPRKLLINIRSCQLLLHIRREQEPATVIGLMVFSCLESQMMNE